MSQRKRKDNAPTDPELAKRINKNLHDAIRKKLRLPQNYERKKEHER